ncbi:hypothetical protein AB4059_09710 [Lysobacter sp. 2RAF19]
MKSVAAPDARRIACASTMLLIATLAATGAVAGQGQGSFGVSVAVVRRHEPQLAASVPVPEQAHLMVENTEGRHYYYEGALESARTYYLDALRREGYVLRSERADNPRAAAMQWQRDDEVLLIDLRAATGLAPTRISLRVMKDARPHAPG